MILGFIFSFFVAIVLFIIGTPDERNDGMYFCLGLFFCIAFELTVVFGVFSFADIENEPQPIDVYRGRTTLEITYRDSVAVDSVVVWKEE